MPTPPSSHLVGIRVYGIDNQLLDGATVTLTITAGSTTETTSSDGEAVLNVADAGSWSVGDEASITASKTGSGTKTETLVLTAAPQKLNITLAETSDLAYYEPTEDDQSETDTYVLNFSLLTTYDGEKVTYSNPLPVAVVNNGLNSNRGYKIARAYNSSNQLLYLGKALAGTGKSETKWQIIKHTYSDNKVTDTLFAGGSDAFDKNWNNRTNYSYS